LELDETLFELVPIDHSKPSPMIVHICGPHMFEIEFEGRTLEFSYHPYMGVTFYKRNGKMYKNVTQKMWDAFHEWRKINFPEDQ
jgi:hypothetical protein